VAIVSFLRCEAITSTRIDEDNYSDWEKINGDEIFHNTNIVRLFNECSEEYVEGCGYQQLGKAIDPHSLSC